MVCNGLRLHYLEWGSDGDPSLILLHGIHGHAHVWDALAGSVKTQFRVLALDLRGHGDSAWAPDGNYDGQTLLSDVAAFVTELQLDHAIVIGESLGGIVAFAYAAMNPTIVKALAVVDIGPEINSEGLEEIRRSAQDRPSDFADFEQALRWSRGDQHVQGDEVIAYRLRHNLKETDAGRLAWKFDPRVDSVTSSGGPEGDALMWQLWSALKCPTLVMRGERSILLTEESASRMLSSCPTATLRVIPGAGHAVLVDNQTGFIEEIKAFLTGL